MQICSNLLKSFQHDVGEHAQSANQAKGNARLQTHLRAC